MSVFKLASSDRHSNTWARLERRINERIAELHVELEHDAPESITAHRRGRIAELRLLLQAADDPPPPVPMADGM